MVKISWGIKIAVLYTSFVGLIIIMVFLSLRQKIDLVSEDYYNKELLYQNKIDELKNAGALSSEITHSFSSSTLDLQFPEEFKTQKTAGEILFFKPSDASKDFKTNLELNENAQQSIEMNKLSKGMYKMQISWKDDKKTYFSEQTIVIP